jgi:predicted  nucleic acid-binding Zn-ribbon protein
MAAVKQAMEYSKQHTLPLQHQITELRNRIEVIANGQMSDVHAAVMPIIDDLKRSLDSYSDERIRAAVSADIGKVYNEINKVKKDTSAALKNSDLIADSLRRAANTDSNSDIHFPHLRGLFKRIDMLEKKSVTEISLSDNLTTFQRRARHSIEDLEKRMTELHEEINELRAQHKPSFDIKPLEEGLANLQSQINKQLERSLETDMKYDKLDKAIRAVDDHYEHTCRLNSVEITHLKELMDGIGRWMTAILKTRFGRKLKIDDNN